MTPDQLRGRIVLLNFWTAGCVNCLRVLDDLAALEDRRGDALMMLGAWRTSWRRTAAATASGQASCANLRECAVPPGMDGGRGRRAPAEIVLELET